MRFVDAVRARPGMYLGSTESLGLLHLYEYVYRTLFDSGLRDHLRVRRDCARVVIESDSVIAPQSLLAQLEDGSDSDFLEHSVWPLLTVSAVSSQFELDVLAGDDWWSWRGERDVPVAGEPLQRRSGPGTTISFTPDPAIFEDPLALTAATLQRRLQELAMLHPGLLVEHEDTSGVRFSRGEPALKHDTLRADRRSR